jgi:nitrous oxidase accessory protein
VQVAGRGDARQARWRANEFDDYAGYDLDGDGAGDVPYELRSLASDLVAERPALAFFRGTPAFALAEAIGRIVPVFEPRLVLNDPEPRMRRVAWEGLRAD